ncbi:MAG: heat-inducible transcriptional repressor HrcA, partial [Acidobacteria bacterium]
MTAPTLDERRREVLRSLIQLHVETGEPVGSESLSRVLNRALSPATLRNLMADLE